MFGKVCKNFYSGSSVHTQPQLCLSQALPRWECNTIPLKSWLFFHRLIWHIGTTWLFPKHLGRLKCIDCSTRRGTGSAKLTPGNTPRTQPLRMSLSFRRRHFLLCWRVDCSHPDWYNVLGDKDQCDTNQPNGPHDGLTALLPLCFTSQLWHVQVFIIFCSDHVSKIPYRQCPQIWLFVLLVSLVQMEHIQNWKKIALIL